MFIALLAVAIGATIISGMITVYKEVPEQMGREFRAYGANLLLLPANGKATMEEAAVAPVYDMLKDKEIIGAAPFLYERLKINESPVLTGGTDFNEVKKVSPYWQINGEMPKENSKEILLGYELSERFQAKPGSQVIVALGDGTKEETYTVSGIVRTGGKEEQFAYVDIKSLWDFLGKPNLLSMVQVSVVANSGDLEALAARNTRCPSADGKADCRIGTDRPRQTAGPCSTRYGSCSPSDACLCGNDDDRSRF